MRPRLERAVRRNTEGPVGRLGDKPDRVGVPIRRGARHSCRALPGRQDRPEVDNDGPGAGLRHWLDSTHLRGHDGTFVRDRQNRDRRLRRHVLRPGAHVLRGDLRETHQRYITSSSD